MGLTGATRQLGVLQSKIADLIVPADGSTSQDGYAKGIPNLLYRYAVRSGIQRIRRSRMDQRSKSSFERHSWTECNRYFEISSQQAFQIVTPDYSAET